MSLRALILSLLIPVLLTLAWVGSASADPPLRVGVYQNYPLSFVDAQGNVRGFFIDLLEHIARKEDWQIEYVPASWSECLENLHAGKIDLLGVIAFSDERNQRFDYTYESVFTEWGQIYVNPDADIESILDFKDKKIAVLQADMHYQNLRDLVERFGFRCRFIEAFEYEDVMMLVERGICSAGLVSHFYGLQYEGRFRVSRSPIILSPQKLYWATSNNHNPVMLYRLDLQIRQLKGDENSIYYTSLNQWFGMQTRSGLTKWILWGSVIAGSLMLFFFGTSMVLRSKVKSRTRELSANNQALQEEIEQRRKAEHQRSLLENRLQRAQKMEAIGTLAGGVAHDLNNILSGLVSYPEILLLDLPTDSPLRKPILTMKDSGERAAAIVQDLLTLARRGVAVTEVLNLNDIVRRYLESPEFARLQAEHPNVTCRTVLSSELFDIVGSPVHLSKTVMNLVVNGIEAITGNGELVVTTENRYLDRSLSGYDTVPEGEYVVLTVSDTGVGINPADLDRIFEPFYTRKKMGRSGSGLGMAVVWGTVKDHHGHIDIRTRKQQGTRFHLYFPMTRRGRDFPGASACIQDWMGHGETILIVDDIGQQREIATEMLRRLGYRTITVESGEAAVGYLEKHRVDLLLLDMIMEPGLDGLDTYRRIAAKHPRQKAVIVSGFSENRRVRAAQRMGAGPYVKKPYTLETLGRAVKQSLMQDDLNQDHAGCVADCG
ncbi:MAG TPA: ATP-binding protein [Desulfobacterales bacterium]